jgi:transposase
VVAGFEVSTEAERIDFFEGKHPYTRRFAAAVARDCEDAAVRRVAAKWGLSASTVRRIDKRSLLEWAKGRRRRPLRQMGVDELFWGKGKCLTVVSDLEAGEAIWAGPERKKATLDRFFAEYLPARRRHAVKAVCIDMWRPFLDSVREHLPKAVTTPSTRHGARSSSVKLRRCGLPCAASAGCS